MEQSVTLNFDELYSQFSQKALAIYKATYLLENESDTLSKDQLMEVKRELNLSKLMANQWFKMMHEQGIPENLLSNHLQVII